MLHTNLDFFNVLIYGYICVHILTSRMYTTHNIISSLF